VVCAETFVAAVAADRTKTEASKYDFIFVNGGWEVLMETESPVKPKADSQKRTCQGCFSGFNLGIRFNAKGKAAKPGSRRGDEGF
jgi:hypothetical protein